MKSVSKILKLIFNRENEWWLLQPTIYQREWAILTRNLFIVVATCTGLYIGIKAMVIFFNGPVCKECSFGILLIGLAILGMLVTFIDSFFAFLISFCKIVYFIPYCRHKETHLEKFPPDFPFHKTTTETCNKCGKFWQVEVNSKK